MRLRFVRTSDQFAELLIKEPSSSQHRSHLISLWHVQSSYLEMDSPVRAYWWGFFARTETDSVVFTSKRKTLSKTKWLTVRHSAQGATPCFQCWNQVFILTALMVVDIAVPMLRERGTHFDVRIFHVGNFSGVDVRILSTTLSGAKVMVNACTNAIQCCWSIHDREDLVDDQ